MFKMLICKVEEGSEEEVKEGKGKKLKEGRGRRRSISSLVESSKPKKKKLEPTHLFSELRKALNGDKSYNFILIERYSFYLIICIFI